MEKRDVNVRIDPLTRLIHGLPGWRCSTFVPDKLEIARSICAFFTGGSEAWLQQTVWRGGGYRPLKCSCATDGAARLRARRGRGASNSINGSIRAMDDSPSGPVAPLWANGLDRLRAAVVAVAASTGAVRVDRGNQMRRIRPVRPLCLDPTPHHPNRTQTQRTRSIATAIASPSTPKGGRAK